MSGFYAGVLRYLGEGMADRDDLDEWERIDLTIWRNGKFEMHAHANRRGEDSPTSIETCS